MGKKIIHSNAVSFETGRLLLRPLSLSDSEVVMRLAGDKKVSDTVLFIPHPYPEGLAARWIRSTRRKRISGSEQTFAVTIKAGGEFLGAMGLRIDKSGLIGDAGYWIGVPYWNKGYATEALRALISFGFETLGLHKITAHYLEGNIASGRVMEKSGMIKEGVQRKELHKNNNWFDTVHYGILSDEYFAGKEGEHRD